MLFVKNDLMLSRRVRGRPLCRPEQACAVPACIVVQSISPELRKLVSGLLLSYVRASARGFFA